MLSLDLKWYYIDMWGGDRRDLLQRSCELIGLSMKTSSDLEHLHFHHHTLSSPVTVRVKLLQFSIYLAIPSLLFAPNRATILDYYTLAFAPSTMTTSTTAYFVGLLDRNTQCHID